MLLEFVLHHDQGTGNEKTKQRDPVSETFIFTGVPVAKQQRQKTTENKKYNNVHGLFLSRMWDYRQWYPAANRRSLRMLRNSAVVESKMLLCCHTRRQCHR